MYCSFPIILRSPAQECYTCLKVLSVNSFASLAKEFELYFLENVDPRPSTIMLLKLKQGEEEILFNFIA